MFRPEAFIIVIVLEPRFDAIHTIINGWVTQEEYWRLSGIRKCCGSTLKVLAEFCRTLDTTKVPVRDEQVRYQLLRIEVTLNGNEQN